MHLSQKSTLLKKHAYQSTLVGLCRILDRSDDEGNRPAPQVKAFSSEVDAGSRKENASKHKG
jgi:hypothetical protein